MNNQHLIDLLCRKLLMSAYLYYHRDASVWSDQQYDSASKIVSDNWHLVPLRYKVLFDPAMCSGAESVKNTGFHFLYTRQVVAGAHAWWLSFHPDELRMPRKAGCKAINLVSGEEIKRREFVYRMKHGGT